MPNVKFFFNHRLTGANFETNKAWFERLSDKSQKKPSHSADQDLELEVKFDFVIGADGAHSSVRYHLMKFTRMNYQQEYIDTLWCEFRIAANEVSNSDDSNSKFKISPHHLHIWPGTEFMFIAIPSLVRSASLSRIDQSLTYP